MANIHIPNDATDNGTGPSPEASKKKYQQSLAYEQAFLKKRAQLEKNAAQEKLKLEIDTIQTIAATELQRINELYASEEERTAATNAVKIKLAEDLAKRGMALAQEKQKAEYQAHLFAADCEMRRFSTMNVHQREYSARQLEATHKEQVAKLKAIKEASIRELEAEKASAATVAEKSRITRQINKEKKEIQTAEAEVVRFQQEAAKYAEVVKRVEFERLSAVDKLTTRENEIIELKKKQRAEQTQMGMSIEAVTMDLASAEASGDSALAEQLRAQLEALKTKQAEMDASYNDQISQLSATLEGEDGLRRQAERAKQEDPLGSVGTVKKITDDPVVNLLEDLVNIASSYQSYLVDTSARAKVASSDADSAQATAAASGSAIQLVDSIKKMSVDASGNTEMQAELNTLVTNLVEMMSEDGGNEELIEQLKELTQDTPQQDGAKAGAEERVHEWNENKANKLRQAEIDRAYRNSAEGKRQSLEDGINRALAKLGDAIGEFNKAIDNNISAMYEYQAEIDARLNGTSMTYSKTMGKVADRIGLSMVVSQKEFIQNYKKLVDAGIAYNLESRTLLMTVGDRVINTFNALEPTLLRIVRLQQIDSTAARMGMESSLNKIFNSYFSDTSYLQDAADSITSAIFDASSQLSNDMSLSFEATVHKWLGSMYSVGFSQETLNKIAQGLNYLGTGNVSGITSDDSLNVLFALGASHAGLSYADLLNNGLTQDSTNKLLKGMLEYLKTIAENGEASKVTQSAYSDVFGVGMSDMMALKNLSEADIANLFGLDFANGTNASFTSVAQQGIDSIVKHTHLSQLTEQIVENATIAAALNIGDNAALYALWKGINILEGLTGGIDIPFFEVWGFGVDLNTSVEELMKLGVAGLSLVGSITSALGSGLSGGLNLLADWNMDIRDGITRGTGLNFTGAASSGFSQSASVSYQSSNSSEDMKATTMSDASASAEEDSKIVNGENQGDASIPEEQLKFTKDIYSTVFDNDNTILKQAVKTYDLLADILPNLELDRLIGGSRVFLTSSVDRLSPSLIDYDSESNALQYKYNISTLTAAYNVLYDGLDAFDTTSSENFWSEVNAGANYTSLSHSTNLARLITTNKGSGQAEDIRKVVGAIAQNQLEAEKVLFPSTVHATLDDVSKKALQLLGQAMLTGGADTTTGISNTSGDTTNPFITQLVAALTSATNIVHVAIEEDNTPGGPF